MNPIYSQFGKLVGWLSGNVIFSADGKNLAFVRGDTVYSYDEKYYGRLSFGRERIVWYDYES